MTIKLETKNIFQELHKAHQKDLTALNQVILNRLECPVPLVKNVARHLIHAGGKRVRPLLTFLSAKMFGHQGQNHIAMGACIEFIHTATLLHDDVIDESFKRRGQSTANDMWGNKTSILVGDFLFSRAFELMVEAQNPEIMKVLSKAATTIATGEVLQLSKEQDLECSEADYFTIIESKTAALFSAACEVGGLIAQQQGQVLETLNKLGHRLGLIFQLTDDLLDFGVGDDASLGKNIGDDIKSGRITLPVIYLLKKDPNSKPLIKACFDPLCDFETHFKTLKEKLVSKGVLTKAQNQIDILQDQSLELLNSLPSTSEKEFLKNIIKAVAGRARP